MLYKWVKTSIYRSGFVQGVTFVKERFAKKNTEVNPPVKHLIRNIIRK